MQPCSQRNRIQQHEASLNVHLFLLDLEAVKCKTRSLFDIAIHPKDSALLPVEENFWEHMPPLLVEQYHAPF